jgi:hypothetical protein
MNVTLHSAFGWQRWALIIGVVVMILGVGAGVFASIASGTATTASSTQVTITQVALAKPASVASGDVMIASIAINGVNEVTTVPPGWIQIPGTENNVSVRLISYWKIAGSSEPGSYVWTIHGKTSAQGAILPFTGMDTTNPIDTAAGNRGFGTVAKTASLTTSVASTELIAIFVTDEGKKANANTYFSTPSGMTEKYDTSNVSSGPSIAADTVVQPAAGNTGSKSSAINSGKKARNWATQIIALRPAPLASSICSGGTISTHGGNTIHTFTSSGTFDCTGTGSKAVEFLLVAGGGGATGGGGGGGGGVLAGTTTAAASTHGITVGAGGNNSVGHGGNGGDSIAFGFTAVGGGGGGANGGSGGGQDGPGSIGNGTLGQGHDGGSAIMTHANGGGGGAGSAGSSKDGGNGATSSISGSSVTYGGGGGGGADATGAGTGGTGGGGAGGTNTAAGSNGTNGLGGGGGATWIGPNGGVGGSGVVIISYPTP